MSGLILIDRAMLDHHIVGIKNPLRFAAWAWMLAQARYKSGKYFHHGHEIDLEIGQFACARSYMSENTGMTEKQVRTFLTALERAEMVTKAVHQKGQGISIISITKYKEYQDFYKYRKMKGPSKGPVKGQGGARVGPDSVTPEVTPEVTPVLVPAKAGPEKRAARLPVDWFLPVTWGDWAVGEGYVSEQIKTEAEKFRDYWIGVGGQKGRKLDWQATWRNWMRNSKQVIGGHNGKRINNGQTSGDAQYDEARERAIKVAGLSEAPSGGVF